MEYHSSGNSDAEDSTAAPVAASFPISDALARSLATKRFARSANPELDALVEAGDFQGIQAWQQKNRPELFHKPSANFRRVLQAGGIIGPHGENRRQKRVRDRTASRGRKRTLGGSGAMPHTIRCHYTEGERAALAVIALEVKRRGFCDWPIDKIAATAGVSKRTVQYALATATAAERRHLKVEYRPIKGRRNRTNLITITSAEWTAWLERGPSLSSINRSMEEGIGCKELHGTKKGFLYPDNLVGRGGFSSSAERGRDAAGGLMTGWNRQSRAQPGSGRRCDAA